MNLDGEPPLTLAPRDRAPAPRRLGRKTLIGGVATACVLGAALGLAARPELGVASFRPKPPPAAAGEARRMEIVMGEPPPERPAPPGPPLETLPPDMIEPPWPPEPPQPPFAPVPPTAPQPAYPPLAPIAREPAGQAQPPGFDCRQAGSLAEEMVCTDAVLAAADRQMSRAYQRAARSGFPRDRLRAEQDDWMAMREDAALRSPRALMALYDRRIDELNAIADGQGPGW